MNAIDRLNEILDPDSLNPDRDPLCPGYLLGQGRMDGRPVYFCAIDRNSESASPFDSLSHMVGFLEAILQRPAPLVLLMDIPASHTGSQRSPFPENPDKLLADRRGVGWWYHQLSSLSGKVPRVCAVFDKMGASLTFPIAMCDAVAMVKEAGMSIGRVDVVIKMHDDFTSYADLGGPDLHAKISGSVDWVETYEFDALGRIKSFLTYLPDAGGRPLRRKPGSSSSDPGQIEPMIPKKASAVLDMDKLLAALADDESVLELKGSHAREIITAFARFEGHVAGVVANRSKIKGGILYPESCLKESRFVSLCDAFGVPLVFLSDAPGFMVGSQMEKSGIVKRGAMLFQTISNAATAKMTIVVRRSYTAGLYAMGGGGMRPDRFVALPSAILSIYGEEVARQLMTGASDDQKRYAEQMLLSAGSPEHYLERGMLDAIVPYEKIREEIVRFVSAHQDGSRASGRPVLIL